MAYAVETVTNSARGQRSAPAKSRAVMRCRRKFLRHFADGFRDTTYFDWERGYKEKAHARWNELLAPRELRALVRAKKYGEVAHRAVSIEARTNLLFSFEKMALRDALRTADGARDFSEGLLDLVDGKRNLSSRFERWIGSVAKLPRRQTRVLTWPIVTVFGFLARPDEQIFLKPTVTRRAAEAYEFDFAYASRPNWNTYENMLAFAALLRRDLRDLRPRDMIDLQSFIWVLGSDEYP
jgi:hypothetical protein